MAKSPLELANQISQETGLSPYESYKVLLKQIKEQYPDRSWAKPSIAQWIDAFNKGAFKPSHDYIGGFQNEKYDHPYNKERVKQQIDAGWYDWWTNDRYLPGKTAKMGKIINQIRPGGKVDLDKNYVWFKNNFPMKGNLYDDFRFASSDTGDVQLTTQIGSPWSTRRFSVYGRTPKNPKGSWDKPLFETDSIKDLINWYNSPWEE